MKNLKEVKKKKKKKPVIPDTSEKDIENDLEQDIQQLNEEPEKLQLEEHGLDD